MDNNRYGSGPVNINNYKEKRDEWRKPENYLKSKMDSGIGVEKTNGVAENKAKKKINTLAIVISSLIGIVLLVGLWVVMEFVRGFLKYIL